MTFKLFPAPREVAHISRQCDCANQLAALREQMQKLISEHDLKLLALLEVFEKQRKEALEFATIPAEPERVTVRRKA